MYRRVKQVVARSPLAPVLRPVHDRLASIKYRVIVDTVDASVDGVEASFRVSTGGEHAHVSDLPEEEVIRDVVREVREGDTFWDVGAHIGTYSCFAGRSSEIDVVAIEAHPGNVRKLRSNIGRNAIEDRSTVVNVGLGSESGLVTLRLSDEYGASHSFFTRSDIDQGEELIVGTATGDELARVVGEPDVVKIDVEGGELDILEGMGGVLDDCRTVYCEVHRIYDVDVDAVERVLSDAGFENISEIQSNEKTVNLVAKRRS